MRVSQICLYSNFYGVTQGDTGSFKTVDCRHFFIARSKSFLLVDSVACFGAYLN